MPDRKMNQRLHLQMCHSFHPLVQTDLMWEVYSIPVIETPCSMLRKFDFLRGDQKILTEFYNDGLLENILKHKLKTSAIDSILILQNYILYYGEPSYVGFFSNDGSDIHRFSNRNWVPCALSEIC